MIPKVKGDLVWIWWDTGAMGSTILYGRVIAAGPRTYRVRWESGLTNRIAQDRREVALVTTSTEIDAATAAMVRAEAEAVPR
jgi:hypothetical protein